jgi:hypothetical protein
MKMSVISTTMPETNATELSQTFILTKKKISHLTTFYPSFSGAFKTEGSIL